MMIKIILKNLILIFLSIKIFFISKNRCFLNKKNLFIDLGTNFGQGFLYFQKFFRQKNFEYVLVEPNPNLKIHIKNLIKEKECTKKIKFINKAAYITNGTKKFYGLVEDPKRLGTSDGGSLLNEHNTKLYRTDKKKAITVKTFDFINYLKKIKKYDNIIIKMDIEGSEYKILDKLIKNINEIKNIKHIFLEFHSRFMVKNKKKEYQIIEKNIIKNLELNNIKYTLWI